VANAEFGLPELSVGNYVCSMHISREANDGVDEVVGFQLVDGEIAGRRGTLVLQTLGEFDGRVARWDATVVPGSSTGELTNATGAGRFEAPHGSTASYELEVTLSDR